jgi:hydroxymethylpyrimidine pyrophosphatase-like HAD family hydrolase
VTPQLPLLGHRNWVVIADSAYPWQTSAGIETIYADGDQIEVVEKVLDAVRQAPHVRPIIYTDAELKFVPEENAPGISAYRDRLREVLGDADVQSLPHEEIIAKLDEAGKTFHVVLLKTDLTLPYTSVFLQLDCGYWTAEAEQQLRDAIEAQR